MLVSSISIDDWASKVIAKAQGRACETQKMSAAQTLAWRWLGTYELLVRRWDGR